MPVLTFEDLSEVTGAIIAGDKPLALYVFTASEETEAQVVADTSSGGVCVNDAVTHLLISSLPFGAHTNIRRTCSPGWSRTIVANPDSKSGGPCRQTNRGMLPRL